MKQDPKIELLIENVQIHCLNRLNRYNDDLKHKKLFDDDFINLIITSLYEEVDDALKKKYSLEDLKNDITELFQVKKPTPSVAEADLETWLNSSKRVNREIRFSAYKQFLAKKKKGEIIEQLAADTYTILDKCHNPNELKNEWDRRGLVYGHVQSGKTANYIGLINRAYDSGYKIVIVLTGMTEDLRVQTQDRIDEGVIGKRDGKSVGIGEEVEFQKIEEIKAATLYHKDLRTSDNWRDSHINVKKKSIWVIKKNKTVLENLIRWLDKQRIAGGQSKIHNVPFLIIDDEADNASIQSLTKKDYNEWGEGQALDKIDFEDLNPSQLEILKKAQNRVIKAINRNIRVILSLMSHKTFVAYTATPYSVINQIKEDFERTVVIDSKKFIIEENSDLFPEHFIQPIKPGDKYMGIERIFPTDLAKKLPVVINLSKFYSSEDLDNDYFTTIRGRNYSFISIPKSLEDAIIHFLLTIFIRKFRDQKDYNSLLIHTSHLTNDADYLADKVESFILKLEQKLLTGDDDYYFRRAENALDEIRSNSKNKLFNDYFDQKYLFPDKIKKTDLLDIILSKKDSNGEYLYAPLEVVSYHSSNSKDLKHENHTLKFDLKDSEGEKKFKNYIVVGGNRLSRGLTLEGLSTSYFVRNSTRQDSLYQMARWFGYRIGFEDLIRIYMPADQIRWFEAVFKLEMDLRKDFEEYNEEDTKMLPRDALIKLAHYTNEDFHIPKELRKRFPAICDLNKLRHTRTQEMSFSGSIRTNRINNDKEEQIHNVTLIKNILYKIRQDSSAMLFDMGASSLVPKECKNTNSNYEGISHTYILNLLSDFKAHPRIADDFDALREFIKKNHDKLDSWSLVLVNKRKSGKNEIQDWKSDFWFQGEKRENHSINYLERKYVEEEENTLYFKSILDQQNDNIFDVIDSDNVSEFISAKEGLITQSSVV